MAAAGGSSVEVEGLARLRRDLRAFEGNVNALKDAHARAAAIVAAAASARAPRRTGRLAASVRGSRAAGKATVVVGGAATPYAGPIHWGWPARRIPAQPFAHNAAIDTVSQWLPAYEQEVQQLADRVGGI